MMAATSTQIPSDHPVVKSVASASQKRKTLQSFATQNVKVKKTSASQKRKTLQSFATQNVKVKKTSASQKRKTLQSFATQNVKVKKTSASQKRKTLQSFATQNVKLKVKKAKSVLCQKVIKSVRYHSTNIPRNNCSEAETLTNISKHSSDSSCSFYSKRTPDYSFMVHKTTNYHGQVQTTACSTSSAYSTEVAASSLQTGFTDTGFPGETSLDRNASNDSSAAEENDYQHEGPSQNHLQTHPEADYSNCEQCDDELCQLSNKTKHFLETINLKPHYTCQQCGIKFRTLCSYKQHMSVHTVPEFYTCQQCGAKFGLLHYLAEHTLTHQKHLHACKHCGALFTSRSYLRQHRILHTGQRPYACKHCDAKYAWRQYLKLHMFLHTGQKPFACKQCGARFLQYSHLEDHMLGHSITLDP